MDILTPSQRCHTYKIIVREAGVDTNTVNTAVTLIQDQAGVNNILWIYRDSLDTWILDRDLVRTGE